MTEPMTEPMTGLTWDEIAQRFDAARNWWVATTGAGGPHSVPVWGVVVDGVLLFYGEESAVRSRNLAADPRMVAHLEDGDSPLILRGRATAGGRAADHAGAVLAYAAKYREERDLQYLPDRPDMAHLVLYTVEPLRAISWELDTFADLERRWRADPH